MCKLKGSFAFNMEKFPSLEKFYTHAVTDVTDIYLSTLQLKILLKISTIRT